VANRIEYLFHTLQEVIAAGDIGFSSTEQAEVFALQALKKERKLFNFVQNYNSGQQTIISFPPGSR
jgi:hypothetical protein